MAKDRPYAVEFTQYLLPDGRKKMLWWDLWINDVATKAREIVEAGFRFECEILRGRNMVSLTICDEEEDFVIQVVPNGPQIPAAVDRLIMEFDLGVAGRIIEERARELESA